MLALQGLVAGRGAGAALVVLPQPTSWDDPLEVQEWVTGLMDDLAASVDTALDRHRKQGSSSSSANTQHATLLTGAVAAAIAPGATQHWVATCIRLHCLHAKQHTQLARQHSCR
jgi:hypothetical protein